MHNCVAALRVRVSALTKEKSDLTRDLDDEVRKRQEVQLKLNEEVSSRQSLEQQISDLQKSLAATGVCLFWFRPSHFLRTALALQITAPREERSTSPCRISVL